MKKKKFVKLCFHSSQAVQISLYFDEFFLRFFKNSNPEHYKIK